MPLKGAPAGEAVRRPENTSLSSGPNIVKKRGDEEWVKDLTQLFEYADHKRYAAWLRWNESWRIYNNQWDFSQKANWQAKNYVPRAFITVEMAASMVRRAMIDANYYFRLVGTSVTSKAMAPILEKILYYYLELLKFRDNIVPPLKGGFVGSLIVLKPHLAPYTLQELNEEQTERRLAGEKVNREIIDGPAISISYPDPYNIWLDPSGRELFVIEREQIDYALARDLADMGVYDHEVLDKIDEDWQDWDRQVREEKRREQFADTMRPEYRREIEFLHFWGSLPRRDGKWAIRNGRFTIANKKYLVRKPGDNPYRHGKIPYVVGSPFKKPFSVYHKGLIEDVVTLLKTMTELLNLALDSTKFSGIKAFELDVDQLDDAQQILSGLYPGKMFTKHGSLSQQNKMIQEIAMENTADRVLPIYQALQTEYANHTAVTEFISGAQSMAPGRTATEVVTKQQQGMGIFGEISRNIEHSVLEPTLEMMAQLVLQYHEDFYSPDVVEILGPDLALDMALMTADERWQTFEPHKMRVKADGISSLMNRTEELQKINAFFQTLGQFAQQLPMMLAGFDQGYFFRGLFTKTFQAFGWNEADFLKPAVPGAVSLEQQQGAGGAGAAGPGGGPLPAAPGAQPQPGQPAPPNPILQTMAQMDQIRHAIGGGAGAPPNGQIPSR